MKPDLGYRAYLLRIWRARDNGHCWRASLENAHTRELHVFAEVANAFSYLEDLTTHTCAEDTITDQAPTSTQPEAKQPEKKPAMWMNVTTLKTDPSDVAKVEAILRKCCRTLPEDPRSRESYQIHSADEPGTIVSMTIWDSSEQQERVVSSEHYVRLIKEELTPLLLAPPERTAFRILGHTICEVSKES
jgi:quinol monooxygenase YgiN